MAFLSSDRAGPLDAERVRPGNRWLVTGLAAVLLLAWVDYGPRMEAAELPSLEYQVKAAFLYNFVKFVQWPPRAFKDPDEPVVIGIFGKDPFGQALDQMIQDKTVSGRRLVVRRLEAKAGLDECHVLFISPSERSLLPVLQQVARAPVLTIGETDEFASSGGVIRFLITADQKVRFQINIEAAKRADLLIDSTLLNLATIIRDTRR